MRGGAVMKVLVFLVFLVFLILLVAGCEVPCGAGQCRLDSGKIPGQITAQELVWHDLLQDTQRPGPPEVVWVQAGDCPDGFWSPVLNDCVLGDYLTYQDRAMVFKNPQGGDWERWYIYVHELMHAHFLYTRGDPDPHHQAAEWGPGLDWPTRGTQMILQAGVFQ